MRLLLCEPFLMWSAKNDPEVHWIVMSFESSAASAVCKAEADWRVASQRAPQVCIPLQAAVNIMGLMEFVMIAHA